MENEEVIKIEHLNKSFGELKAVNDLSFSVKKGELFAFLGVNGAGKSTTISIICGQLKKDSGEVTVCGESVEKGLDKIARKLGVVFQNSLLDKPLTVKPERILKGGFPNFAGCLNFQTFLIGRLRSFRVDREEGPTLRGRCFTSLKYLY